MDIWRGGFVGAARRLGRLGVVLPPPRRVANCGNICGECIGHTLSFIFTTITIILLSPLVLLATTSITLYDNFPVFCHTREYNCLNGPFQVFGFHAVIGGTSGVNNNAATLGSPHVAQINEFLHGAGVSRLTGLFGVVHNRVDFINPHPRLLQCAGLCSNRRRCVLGIHPKVASFDSYAFVGLSRVINDRGTSRVCRGCILGGGGTLHIGCTTRISFGASIGVFFGALFNITRGFFFAISKGGWNRPLRCVGVGGDSLGISHVYVNNYPVKVCN